MGSTACPQSYVCQYSIPFLRWQCCTITTLTVSRTHKWPSPNPSINAMAIGSGFSSLPTVQLPTAEQLPPLPTVQLPAVQLPAVQLPVVQFNPNECGPHAYKINNICLQLLYPGQRGCTVSDQCALKVAETRCDAGYCMCPAHKLIHRGRCVGYCPDGYINVAARCNDITKVVMMDAVDERQNGTIGGWCLDTVVKEKQCTVEHSECSQRSLTCQCKHGYELEMDFYDYEQSEKPTGGVCISIEDSKWHLAADEPEMSGDSDIYFENDSDQTDASNGLFLQIDDL